MHVEAKDSAGQTFRAGMRCGTRAELTAFGPHPDEKHHEYSEETEARYCGYGEDQDYGVHQPFLLSLCGKFVAGAELDDFSELSMISALLLEEFA
jgi:hypothetical protein